jgi:hypothetical protein
MSSGPEIQINNATTTLATAYTAGSGTISVATSTSYGTGYGQFPIITGGQFFRVKCGSVIFKVTAVNTSTNVWAVTVVETTDASQTVNAALASVTTAAAVNSLTQSGFIADTDIAAGAGIQQSKLALDADPGAHEVRHLAAGLDAFPWATILGSGTDASKPAAANTNAGYLWIATDTNKIYQSSGTAWIAVLVTSNGTFAGEVSATDFKASGLTGAVAASRYAGATTSGAPTTGTFALGDFIIDQTGKLWICTTAGTSGTWTAAAGGGSSAVATVSAVGTVEIDVIPASGNPISLTAGGLTPASTTGAPTTGTWALGELHVDSAHALFVCVTAGTPGSWAQITGGGTTAAATTTALGTIEIDTAPASGSPVALTQAGTALPAAMLGTTATTAAAGNDSRLSNARTPLAHESTHLAAGTDALPWTTIHGSGTLASRPAAASTNAGYTYFATDLNVVYQSTGTAWTARGSAGTGSALPTATADYVGTLFFRTSDNTLWYCNSTPAWVQAAGSGSGSYTLPDATTAAIGGVKVDHVPPTGDPVVLTSAPPPSGDTTGATDNAALQALLNAGRSIQLQDGTYYITGLTTPSSGPVQILGRGARVTTIYCNSSTATAIQLGHAGCEIRDVTLLNTGSTTPTAGAAIGVDTTSASAGNYTRLIDLHIDGFYRNVDMDKGYYWFMDRCYLGSYVANTLRIQNTNNGDQGDMVITNSFFTTDTTRTATGSLVLYQSGGGLRFANNKLNYIGTGPSISFELAVADGVASGDLIIEGNSIENYTSTGIYLHLSGSANTGTWQNLLINGNEFEPAGSTQTSLNIAPEVTGKIKNIVATGNTFIGGATGIAVANVDTVSLGTNAFDTVTTNISIGGSVTNLSQTGTTTTIAASGGSALSGAVTLAAGSNVTLSESGQTITIASSGGGTSVPYSSLTNQNAPDLIFTGSGDVVACPA